MKKSTIIAIIAVVAVIIIGVIIAVSTMNAKPTSNLTPVNSAEDLSALVDKLYEGQELFSSVATQTIDLTDADQVKFATGLDNGDNLQYAVVSEPMITSQAYSLVLAKVKEGVNASEVAKTMSENIDTRKWICVSAEKLYATNSGDIVCLVMSNEQMAKPVYEKFKQLAGSVGQEYQKTEQPVELPEDMY